MAGTVARAEEAASARVPRKKLGSTGEEIPVLLAGCAQKFDPRYDKLLHRAYASGVDYLDTALVYAGGQSHRTLAPFIQQVERRNLWITSKAPHHSNAADEASLRGDLDTCLEQLKTDYLDLFFIHQVDDPKYLGKEYLKMGDALKKEGKTRFFGFSCHDGNVAELMTKAAEVGGIDVIMFRYSFAKYGDLELNKAIDACKKAGIGLIAMKTQGSVPDDKADVVEFASQNFSLAQAKLKSVWADERIDAAVSHMDNLKKLQENVDAAKSPVALSLSEQYQLNRLARETAPYACQGCKHLCESRVEGPLKIADSLRFLMYHECYGESDKGAGALRAPGLRRARLRRCRSPGRHRGLSSGDPDRRSARRREAAPGVRTQARISCATSRRAIRFRWREATTKSYQRR